MSNHATPRFSIITVTYNAADTVEETIQSVIAQTCRDVEYIIVDGASTDGTAAILEKYRTHINKLISEPDKGIYDAMNKGLAAATGEYLCFLNAGDRLHEACTLQNIALSISADKLPDVIYGETAIVSKTGRFLRMRRLSAPETLTWKSFGQGMLVCHQAFFAKRTLAEPYDLQYKFSSDFDWCVKIMKKSTLLHNTHLIIIDYLEEGVTTANRRKSLLERFRIMGRHYGWGRTVVRHVGFVFRLLTKPH